MLSGCSEGGGATALARLHLGWPACPPGDALRTVRPSIRYPT